MSREATLVSPKAFPRTTPGRPAEWRRYAKDPETVGGWTRRALVEDAPWAVLATLGVFALIVLVLLAVAWMCGVGIELFALSDLSWLDLRLRSRQAPESIALLAASPSVAPWYPVRVRLQTQGMDAGRDEALASFVDGWLHVEGRRASFSLRPNLVSFGKKAEYHLDLPDGRAVIVEPFDRIGNRKRLREAFDRAFRRWRSGPCPEGAPTYPPRGVHPWAFGRAWAAVVLGEIFLSTSALALALWPGVATGIVAGVVALCGLWRLVRGALDLRRLRSFKPPASPRTLL